MFTGQYRDPELVSTAMPDGGLDYFGARYFSSAQGRFTSPDWSERPEPVPYAKLENPQTLNLYTYGQNNPLRRTDPDGHCTVDNEEHGFLWCLGHVLGVTETKQEEQNYADNQRNRIAEKHLALENGQSLDQKYLATLSNADVNTLAHQLAGQQMDQAFAALSIMDLFGGGGKDITPSASVLGNIKIRTPG